MFTFFLRYLKTEKQIVQILHNLTASTVYLPMLAYQKSREEIEMVVSGGGKGRDGG